MPFGQEPPQLLKHRLFYEGKKFNFEVSRFRLPNQSVGDWECIRHPGGAMAVPITADNQFVLVRQYRFALQARLLEFPAGTVEVGEQPLVTIQREIEEETGYKASTWKSLGKFPNAPGYSDEIIYAYLATDLEKLPGGPRLEEDEDLEVLLMDAETLDKEISSGAAIDAKSIAAFYMARSWLDHG